VNPGSGRPRPTVAIAEPIDPVCLDWLSRRCRCAGPGPEAIPEAQGLIVRTATRVDASLLQRAPNLRVVGRAGVGVDHIDLQACADRGVVVVHTPEANTDAVVEYVFAQLFALVLAHRRPIPRIAAPMTPDAWERLRERAISPTQLSGSTLAVLGFGRIGARVGAVGRTLGMDVIYHDLLEIPPGQRAGCRPVTSEDLLAGADILTIHVDGRPENRRLIDADALGRCKPDVLLINTSRGHVVDAQALGAFLRDNPDARAVCDVHDPEPVDESNPLLGLPNATLTPHVGAATEQAKRAMSWVVRDVWRVLSGQEPEHPAPRTTGASLPAQ